MEVEAQAFLVEHVTRASEGPRWDACVSLLAALHPARAHLQLSYELEAEAALVFAAARAGEVHGLLVAHRGVEAFELTDLIVNPLSRRLGVASLLLTALLDAGRSSRKEAVYLEVRGSNRSAVRLYQTHGFVEVGCRRNYYDAPTEDALVFRFDLSDAT